MDRINLGHYLADEISDPHTRAVATLCQDRQRSELINHPWGEERCGQEGCGPDGCDNCRLDEEGRKTIARHIKRHRREGYYYTTHLYRDGIAPDNNAVERVNRKFVAIRNDGGGNRSSDGMEANSVLFTIKATDRINGPASSTTWCGHHPGTASRTAPPPNHPNKTTRPYTVGCACLSGMHRISECV